VEGPGHAHVEPGTGQALEDVLCVGGYFVRLQLVHRQAESARQGGLDAPPIVGDSPGGEFEVDAVEPVVDDRQHALAQACLRRIGQEDAPGHVEGARTREVPSILGAGPQGQLEGPAGLDHRLVEPVEPAGAKRDDDPRGGGGNGQSEQDDFQAAHSSTSSPAVLTAVS